MSNNYLLVLSLVFKDLNINSSDVLIYKYSNMKNYVNFVSSCAFS